jgi:hypothetical protein
VRLAGTTNPVLAAVRDAGMRLVDRLPGSSSRLVRAAQQEDPAQLVRYAERLPD